MSPIIHSVYLLSTDVDNLSIMLKTGYYVVAGDSEKHTSTETYVPIEMYRRLQINVQIPGCARKTRSTTSSVDNSTTLASISRQLKWYLVL
jgi:hypothetical protein